MLKKVWLLVVYGHTLITYVYQKLNNTNCKENNM